MKLLMAAHDAGISEDDARAWSERGENFDPSDFRSTWRSIKPGAITARTLFGAAIDAGWSASPSGSRATGAERALRDAEHAERRKQEAAKRVEREAEAAKRAARIWNEAGPADDDHPYLLRKHVPAYGLRIGRWERLDRETGEVHFIENALLIQIRDMGKKIHSLQAVFPSNDNVLGRDRDYLPGGAKQGHFFAIGQPRTIDGKKTIVIAEGYATSASIHQCTGYATIVAFDASNLEPVANVIRKRIPDAPLGHNRCPVT
ncbi:PriCT-2 domain-containing protein [Castellaniella sp.]|uniref:PriCT-2 domain-containing protein n=1 Tax=Castellaniella sp. TaxID=1955812 RepID=UPI0025B83AC3|nr:PriCT-2 domain-containing protein [Castellaniella sp.]